MNTITEPTTETVNWEELRPPCSVRHPFGACPSCNSPADWWHKLQCCNALFFSCDRHHNLMMEDEGYWGCGSCHYRWAPAHSNVHSMGRL